MNEISETEKFMWNVKTFMNAFDKFSSIKIILINKKKSSSPPPTYSSYHVAGFVGGGATFWNSTVVSQLPAFNTAVVFLNVWEKQFNLEEQKLLSYEGSCKQKQHSLLPCIIMNINLYILYFQQSMLIVVNYIKLRKFSNPYCEQAKMVMNLPTNP